MRSPLGDLLHDFLDTTADVEARRAILTFPPELDPG